MGRYGWMCALLIGCKGPVHDEPAFEAEFAERWCDRQEQCALGAFERDYSSIDDCVDDKEDDLQIPNWDEGCDFDPDGARKCLDYLRDTECAGWERHDIDEACEHAYDC